MNIACWFNLSPTLHDCKDLFKILIKHIFSLIDRYLEQNQFKFKRKSKETKNKIYFKKDTPINTFRAKQKKISTGWSIYNRFVQEALGEEYPVRHI